MRVMRAYPVKCIPLFLALLLTGAGAVLEARQGGERGLLGLMLRDYLSGGQGGRFLGSEVVEVTPGLPAERAGIEAGDIILAIDQVLIESTHHLQVTIAGFRPGTRVNVKLARRNEIMDIPVRLGGWNAFLLSEPRFGMFSSVVTLRPLDGELRRRYGLGEEVQGLVVTGIDPNSTYRTVLSEGAVIQRINGQPVRQVAEVLTLLQPDLNRLEVLEDGVVGSLAIRGY